MRVFVLLFAFVVASFVVVVVVFVCVLLLLFLLLFLLFAVVVFVSVVLVAVVVFVSVFCCWGYTFKGSGRDCPMATTTCPMSNGLSGSYALCGTELTSLRQGT